MPSPAEIELRDLLDRDLDRGWRRFVDEYTPTILACLERLGIRDRDEAMDLYALVCDRLAERNCERLRRRDPAQGALGAWLSVVVRHVAVDWVRSRAGRRRLFGVVADLDPFHQQVFQAYYWADRMPSAIAESLGASLGRTVSLGEVLAALDTIHDRLEARHYRELVSMTARSRPASSLDAEMADKGLDPRDPSPAPDARVEAREREAAMEQALAALPAEDAAVIRLHYLQGLSLTDVQRALHLPSLSRSRVSSIVAALRQALEPFVVPPTTPRAGAEGSST